MFLIATLRFKVRDVTVHLLLEIKLFTTESIKNNCMRKKISRLALLCSILDIVLMTILVMVPIDMLLFIG